MYVLLSYTIAISTPIKSFTLYYLPTYKNYGSRCVLLYSFCNVYKTSVFNKQSPIGDFVCEFIALCYIIQPSLYNKLTYLTEDHDLF